MKLYKFSGMPEAANDAYGGDNKRDYWQQYFWWPAPIY